MPNKCYKILLLGNSGVGKTSVMMQAANERFDLEHVTTIGVDYRTYKTKVGQDEVKLGIWDCAGQERFRHIVSSYFRDAHAVFLMFDICNWQSFKDIATWYELCQSHKETMKDNVVFALVGCKSDLQKMREVHYEDFEQLAQKLGIDIYYEVSAKLNYNITKLLSQTAKRVLEVYKNEPEKEGIVDLDGRDSVCSCRIL